MLSERPYRYRALTCVFPPSSDSSYRLVQRASGRPSEGVLHSTSQMRSSSFIALHVVGDTFLHIGVDSSTGDESRVLLSVSNSYEPTAIASVAVNGTGTDPDCLLVGVASELLAGSLIERVTREPHLDPLHRARPIPCRCSRSLCGSLGCSGFFYLRQRRRAQESGLAKSGRPRASSCCAKIDTSPVTDSLPKSRLYAEPSEPTALPISGCRLYPYRLHGSLLG